MNTLKRLSFKISRRTVLIIMVVFALFAAPVLSWQFDTTGSSVVAQQNKKSKQAAQKKKQQAAAQKKKQQAAKKKQQQAAQKKKQQQAAQQQKKSSNTSDTRRLGETFLRDEHSDWEKRVAQVEAYNAKVAAYMTRDIDHRIGMWGNIGYSAIFPFKFADATPELGFTSSTIGGVGGGVGLGYQLRYKRLLLTTGLEYESYNSFTGIAQFCRSFAMTPYPTMTYTYTFNSMKDYWQTGYVQLPLLFGMELNDWYWQAGAKIGLNVLGSSRMKGLLTTSIKDEELISDLHDMFNHALVTDYEIDHQKENLSFGFNTALSVEAGLLLDRWMQPKVAKGKKLTPAQQFAQNLHLRLAVFAEYGVLNIYKAPGNPTLDIPVDFSKVIDNDLSSPDKLYKDVRYCSSLSTTTAKGGVLNPFLVGVKLSVWYDLPRKQKKMLPIPTEPTPRMALAVANKETNQPVQGTQLTITNTTSDKTTNKTTNSKGQSIARLAKGSYVVSAYKKGYLPSDTILVEHKRDLKDTIFFALQPEAQPVIPTLCGYIVSEQNRQPLEAELRIIAKADTTQVYAGTANEEGFFATDFQAGQYDINLSCKGYMPRIETINFVEDTIWLTMNPIKEGVVTRIDNLYFATNKTYVLPESEGALEQLADFMRENSAVSIRIVGHTDAVGSDEANMRLSLGRAKAVRAELISRGIDADRIEYEGRGESEPIATNDTEEGRQQNRRVEFEILSVE